MLYPFVEFVCQMLLSSLLKLVYKHVNTRFVAPLYDDAVFSRLELLQKHKFNIENIKNHLKLD